ncbi:dienelactone hydrolase family protein [Aureliella helgolandensis]|uniref:Carboxymethylenebutenolidase n=1 Tax=Aureliella helgolandensis TaxID=2527968 RepID=A0A518GDV0_9BACT|nr:dienelactone hydrolase family protein [Aureliella helgolandensis]QDV26776.1 Carboxymethylenebutenolidase [Aureliella helgolandensis]
MLIRPPEYVDLNTSFGPMRTHLFRPSSDRLVPAVVLYSEIYQMTGPIARTAALLAGWGYLVAVPEVYHEFEPAGTSLNYDTEGTQRGNNLKTTKQLASYDEDAAAVIDFLCQDAQCNGRLGTLGICLGGHLAYRAALDPRIVATACLYATDIHQHSLGAGLNDDSLARISEIQGELLFVWGRQDPHIPLEGRQMIYQALVSANRNFAWHEFNGQHAFMRDEGHRYDPAIAKIVYAMIEELFSRLLR